MARFPYNALVFREFVQLEHRHGLAHRVRSYWDRTWEGGGGGGGGEGRVSAYSMGAGPSPALVLIMVRFELEKGCTLRYACVSLVCECVCVCARVCFRVKGESV
jgi:hypothetical protein